MIGRRMAIGAAALAAGALAITPVVQGLGAESHQASAKGPLFATLLGANEAPGPGDSNGRGSAAVLFPSAGRVCYAILVDGIGTPNAAHIHRGARGVAGPIVVNFRPPRAGNPGTVSGCVNAPSRVVSQIVARPGSYYVNVHNGAFPGGAIRGQLSSR